MSAVGSRKNQVKCMDASADSQLYCYLHTCNIALFCGDQVYVAFDSVPRLFVLKYGIFFDQKLLQPTIGEYSNFRIY